MTNLSVNLNKVALLRNQRDIGYPDITQHAKLILEAGAKGLTIHPRPDERHIRQSDVGQLATFLNDYSQKTGDQSIELNIEGYPSEAFIELVLKNNCHQVTLVPDSPSQRTSDHGWDIKNNKTTLRDAVSRLQDKERRVSIFIDPVPEMIRHAKEIGTDRVELYTGPYATHQIPLKDYIKTAKEAKKLGLKINAGHDLNLDNLGRFIGAMPECAEVSIGHAIVADALIMGWNGAVHAYLTAIQYGQKAGKKQAA